MENRIPIDELFHDKLSQGREQLNLGAWANMERMLDGKNPYAPDEEKRKHRLLPLFWLLLLTTGITGAGFWLHSVYLNSQNNNTVAINPGTTKPVSDQLASPAQSTATSTQPSSVISEGKAHEAIANQKNGTGTASKAAIPATGDQQLDLAASSRPKSGNHKMNIKKADLKLAGKADNNEKAISHTKSTQKGLEKTGKAEPSQLAATASVNKTGILSANHSESTSSSEAQDKIIQKIPMVTINQKSIHKRDGSIQKIVGDTIGRSVYERVTQRPVDAVNTASVNPMISNPRFRNLTPEEEKNAAYERQENSSDQSNAPAVASASTISVSHTTAAIASKQQNTTSKKTDYFDDLKKFASDTYRKISNYFLFHPRPDMYNGINMGFNASMSNSKHNFGGFQGGFTTLKPINDYFSYIAECKFFYRNNGGYTANDSYYRILNANADTLSLSHVQKTIYSYQKDSTSKTYNFKNFYSIEVPILVQFNYRSFAVYGGVNLAYNFKLNTTEKSRNYVIDYHDTLPASMGYSFPVEKLSILQQSDFSSRFGVGYAFGASYSFSPQLHLDLRITQNVWDNMRTLSARELSSGFFKVPNIQFAVGYRFRKFTPDN